MTGPAVIKVWRQHWKIPHHHHHHKPSKQTSRLWLSVAALHGLQHSAQLSRKRSCMLFVLLRYLYSARCLRVERGVWYKRLYMFYVHNQAATCPSHRHRVDTDSNLLWLRISTTAERVYTQKNSFLVFLCLTLTDVIWENKTASRAQPCFILTGCYHCLIQMTQFFFATKCAMPSLKRVNIYIR